MNIPVDWLPRRRKGGAAYDEMGRGEGAGDGGWSVIELIRYGKIMLGMDGRKNVSVREGWEVEIREEHR